MPIQSLQQRHKSIICFSIEPPQIKFFPLVSRKAHTADVRQIHKIPAGIATMYEHADLCVAPFETPGCFSKTARMFYCSLSLKWCRGVKDDVLSTMVLETRNRYLKRVVESSK